MNYYPFHIGDYLSATRHLSWEEDAAYRRLLDTYYTTEKPLPVELRAVCRLVLATTDTQREAVQVVLEEFFVLTDGGWINSRADAEIDAMRDKQQKQRDKANKRWHKPETEPGNAPAMPRHEEIDAVACGFDADAMPPTPTPTPTPIAIPSLSAAKLPTCQTQKIIELYHAALPELPTCKILGKSRDKALHKFWEWVFTAKRSDGRTRASTAEQAVEWIDAYFHRARDNDFLMGRLTQVGTHANWVCDLDFLLTEKGMKQVIEKTREAA
jgi:uncharacterized protein YdaU (DUF1376 family)